MKEDLIQLDGVVEEVLAGSLFKVKVSDSHIVTAHLSGKIRINKIKILLGDRVIVGLSSYDPSRGIIMFRKK